MPLSLFGQMWLELIPVLRLERKLRLLQFRTALSERVRQRCTITWKGEERFWRFPGRRVLRVGECESFLGL